MSVIDGAISDTQVAEILGNAFAFKHEHEGLVHVVKASGKIVDDENLRRQFAQQVTVMRRDLGLKVIVVHGAGKQIDAKLAGHAKKSIKQNGLRVSFADHIELIDEATREANELLCQSFRDVANGHIFVKGISGHDSDLGLTSAPVDADNDNFSGEAVLDFNRWYLKQLLDDGRTIPIITNMCANFRPISNVAKINVNADAVAAKLAIGMQAHRLLMCSDVPGVLEKVGAGKMPDFKPAEVEALLRDGKLRIIPEIRHGELPALKKRGVLSDGMLVKVNEAFTTATRMGPKSAVIIMDHNFLVELLTPKGRGTMFRSTLDVA